MSQVKVAILKYIETLTLQMEAPDFVNSSETRLAVSRIITWTTEPKSSDVRKVPTQFIVETVDTTDTSQAGGKKCHPGWFSNTHKRRKDGVDCSRSLCNWEECILCVTGSPVGANLTVPAQHSRVHNAAGSFAQNVSGRCHQAASKPPEEYWQRCTGKHTRAHTHQVSQSTQSLYCKVYCCPNLCVFLSRPQAPMGSPLTRHTPRSPASWSSPVTSPTNTSQNTPSPRYSLTYTRLTRTGLQPPVATVL